MNKHFYLLFALLLLHACQEPVISTGQTDTTQLPSSAGTPQPSSSSAVTTQTRLSGVVKNAATGELLSNTQIRLDTQEVSSDDAGFYQFESDLQGPVKLIVQRPGFQDFSQTLNLSQERQILDILLFPSEASSKPTGQPPVSPSPSPSTNPSANTEPIILLPDGTTATPSPEPTDAASPTPSPSPSASASASAAPSPSPSPSASPAFDPKIEEIEHSQIIIQLKENDLLSLSFLFETASGLPVNWDGGTVNVEYFLATSDSSGGAGEFLTSGKSLVTANGDGFSVSIAGRNLKQFVQAQYTLKLPDGRSLNQNQTVQLSQ